MTINWTWISFILTMVLFIPFVFHRILMFSTGLGVNGISEKGFWATILAVLMSMLWILSAFDAHPADGEYRLFDHESITVVEFR